ncbi:MAG: TGS domain-containing protein [Terriglobia bacterium]
MPANLTPEYLAAEERFKQARTPEEKIAALEAMLSAIPKHKGTEKMQGDLKRRLKRVRGEKGKKGATRHAAPIHYVEHEGAGQVALVGPPNCGKSALLAALTRATPAVADYPFSTRSPLPGMMPFENIQVQLVDLPPLDPLFPEAWVPQTIRNADAVALLVDLGDPDLLDHLTQTLEQLDHGKIRVAQGQGELPRGFVRKPALLVGNKCDRPGARDNLEVLAELWGERFRLARPASPPARSAGGQNAQAGGLLPVSAQTGENLEELRRVLFELLGVVRVYTKSPGKKADREAPYVLPRGATVRDVAARVHKDIAAGLKFARLWGGTRFDGQRVDRDHLLDDQDIVELHT